MLCQAAEFRRYASVRRLNTRISAARSIQPNIFLSCSADWTVKLWKDDNSGSTAASKHLISFSSSNDYVADIRWAPTHSTVFGSVTGGMDVVKAIEGCGSDSGATSKKITIADCGQIS